MKSKTSERLVAINNGHDWEDGQVRSGGGTRLSQTDTCRLCALARHWYTDPQNGVNASYRFSDHLGQDVRLCDVPITCDETES